MELAGRDIYFGQPQPNAISSLQSTVGIQAKKILELETRIKALESIIFEGKSFGHFAQHGGPRFSFPASPTTDHGHAVALTSPGRDHGHVDAMVARLRAGNPAAAPPPPPPPPALAHPPELVGPSALRLPKTARSTRSRSANPNPNAWSASSSSDQEIPFTSVRGPQQEQRGPSQEDDLLGYYDLFHHHPGQAHHPGPIEPPKKRLSNQRRNMFPEGPSPPLHGQHLPGHRSRQPLILPQPRGNTGGFLSAVNSGRDGLPPAHSQDVRMGSGHQLHRHHYPIHGNANPSHHPLQTKNSGYVTNREWKDHSENEHQRSMTPEPTQQFESPGHASTTKPQDNSSQIPPRLYRSLDLRASVCKLLWIPVADLSKAEKIPDELKQIYRIEDWNSLTDEQVEYTVSTQLKFLRKMRPIIYSERLGEMTEILRQNGYTESPTEMAKMSEINKYLKDCGYKPQRTKKKVFKPNLENGISPVEIWRDYGQPLSDQIPTTIDDGLPAAPYTNPKKGKKTIREKVAAQKTKLAQVFECENETDLVHINQLPPDVRSYYRGSKPASHRVVQKVFTAQSKLIKHYQDVLTVLNQKDDLKRLLKVDKLDPNSPQIPPKLRALYLDRTRIYLMHPETRRELKDRQQKFITEYRNQVITPIKRSLTRVLRARGYPPALDEHAVLNTSQIRYYFRSINFDKWKQIREDSLTDICDELEAFLTKPDSNAAEKPAHEPLDNANRPSQPSSPRENSEETKSFNQAGTSNIGTEPGYETDELRVGVSPILGPTVEPQDSQLASVQVGSIVRRSEEDDLRVSEVETSSFALPQTPGFLTKRATPTLHPPTPAPVVAGAAELDNKNGGHSALAAGRRSRDFGWMRSSSTGLQGV